METFVTIILSVPVGIITSFIFLLIIYQLSRPRIQISNEISHFKSDYYQIKVNNKTKFEIINVKAKLFRVKVSNIANGTLKTHFEIKLENNELFTLGRYESTSSHEDYGWRFKTKEDLRKYIQDGDFIKFQIIAQNSYSNAIKVFEKRFDTLNQITEGTHVYGTEMTIR